MDVTNMIITTGIGGMQANQGHGKILFEQDVER